MVVVVVVASERKRTCVRKNEGKIDAAGL